jgi:hypothetical protein
MLRHVAISSGCVRSVDPGGLHNKPDFIFLTGLRYYNISMWR